MLLSDMRNCDCREALPNIADCSVDLVATDCPYHIVSGGCTNKGAGNGIFQKEKASSGKLFAHNEITFSEWLPEVYRILKAQTHCYIFCNGRNLMQLQAEAEKVGFQYQNTLIWEKGNLTPNRYYMIGCEFILMLRKGKAKTILNPNAPNLLKIKNPVGRKLHPTEKPVELMRILIENSTSPGDLVCDPFMGSGSTGIACLQSGRRFIGFEIDAAYFEIADRRISEATGNTGNLFAISAN